MPHPNSGPAKLTGQERTPITVAWALEELAGQMRRERWPLGESIRRIVGVAAQAMVDAAVAMEQQDAEEP